MPVELTPYNVDRVLGVYAERFHLVVPEVLEQLLDPDIDDMTLYTYCKAIHDRLEKDHRPTGHMGFDSFGEACFEGGIVKTFLQIAKCEKTDQWVAPAAYFALQALWMLMKTGTSEERTELLKETLEEGVVDLCLDKAINSPLVVLRQGAVNLLRCLSSESFLGEFLSADETASVVIKMCDYILLGPQIFIEQFGNAALTWQSFTSFGKFGTSRHNAARYAPRYYAMSQESAAWTIQGLFLRCPPPSLSFCHEVLKKDPAMVDLLFKAAATKRPPWYAELAVDSIMMESILLIFRVPEFVIPGLEVNLEDDPLQTEAEEEWKSLLASLQLLIERPNWVKLLHAVWDMLDDEKPAEVKRMLMEGEAKYLAKSPYELETFLGIFEYRASARICIARLITNLSHLVSIEKISQDDILSLLRMTDSLVRPPPKPMREVFSERDQYHYLETTFELFRKPLFAVFTEEEVDPPLQIADEPTLGPTAHIRVLTLLAERGLLANLSKITKLPKAVGSRMTLAQLKQLCKPEAIRKFLLTSKSRITLRRESGHKRFRKDREMDYACIAYFTGAELAAALIAFDTSTEGQYKAEIEGARKEQVLCLGNAAEMSLMQDKFEEALFYATGAVISAEGLPTEVSGDAIDASITEKNKRRIARAKEGLSRETYD